MTKHKFSIEDATERLIFSGRWLLAPLYVGLLLAIVPLLYRFAIEFYDLVKMTPHADIHALTLQILQMLDTVLLGNLILIVIFAGYENFVSKINAAQNSEDRPHWMGRVDYSGLKIKLIGSLVAISVIELLRDFMQSEPFSAAREGWRIGIHVTFVISGVLFALMDFIADKREAVEISNDVAISALEE